jgi:hypothetical protein
VAAGHDFGRQASGGVDTSEAKRDSVEAKVTPATHDPTGRGPAALAPAPAGSGQGGGGAGGGGAGGGGGGGMAAGSAGQTTTQTGSRAPGRQGGRSVHLGQPKERTRTLETESRGAAAGSQDPGGPQTRSRASRRGGGPGGGAGGEGRGTLEVENADSDVHDAGRRPLRPPHAKRARRK